MSEIKVATLNKSTMTRKSVFSLYAGIIAVFLGICQQQQHVTSFTISTRYPPRVTTSPSNRKISVHQLSHSTSSSPTKATLATTTTSLYAASPELDVISLVVGQENYGLAVVCLGEGIYSFLSAPLTISNAVRVIVPNAIAAIVLIAVSGPMISSESADAASIGTGLYIATATTVVLGINYVLRLLASYSETPKEIAALGLLVAVAGFFSFSQNLVVDGFLQFPSLQLPEIF